MRQTLLATNLADGALVVQGNTDVVVGGAVTALLLAIAVQIEKHLDTLDPDELDPLRD